MHLKTLRYSRTHYFFLLSDFALLRQNAWDTRQMWKSLELFEKKQQVWGHWWKDGQDEDAYLWRQALVSAYRSSTPLLCSLPSLIVWTSIFSWNFSTAELHLGPPAQVCCISFHHPVEGNKISQEIFGYWRLQHSPVSVFFDKTSHFLSKNFSESPNANWMRAGLWEMRTECSIADVPPLHHVLTSPVGIHCQTELMARLHCQPTFQEWLAIILQSANALKPLISSVAPNCQPPRFCQHFLLLFPNHTTTPLITTVQPQTELPAEEGHREPVPHYMPPSFHPTFLLHVLC